VVVGFVLSFQRVAVPSNDFAVFIVAVSGGSEWAVGITSNGDCRVSFVVLADEIIKSLVVLLDDVIFGATVWMVCSKYRNSPPA
jgi:hypothetical protein